MANDYFTNHERARRFPWSIYHAPLERDLTAFLDRVAEEKPGARVLVIGCGLMQELDRAPRSLAFTVADIDQRAIDAVLARRDPRIAGGLLVKPEEPLAGHTFDAIYAKEVIEHIVAWPDYLKGLRSILAPGGRLWLSTPNYGDPWLPLLENTVLELVARRSGFSRRDLHPSRFSEATLQKGLDDAGFTDVDVHRTPWRLALVAQARKAA
jgi:SAM-dependent methyltransferase